VARFDKGVDLFFKPFCLGFKLRPSFFADYLKFFV
jgi:hypothetical protein